MAYGSFQASSQIRASPEAYSTAVATPDPSHIYNLRHKLAAMVDPNPLSEARDGTHILPQRDYARFLTR